MFFSHNLSAVKGVNSDQPQILLNTSSSLLDGGYTMLGEELCACEQFWSFDRG